ncbi:hypothetical protein [Helicobacter sp. MIT 14-3879]|uniref:hypothetical protein n=1 Tax=Helicobacter sp. MIT 14-3879 TaxID=2040649 RepID=UPI000E1EBEFB|nr:hypothetical protein [Helicobacter sp. MIT 14-3879]RDU65570.1 hypothetical protein CQA44_00915 [Helicobacter sp. MIT 14-3879]
MKFFAQFIYQQILNANSKIFVYFLLKLRKILLKFINPIITLNYRGFKLDMPLSHTIFYYQKLYPNYDMQLHKIASYIKHKLNYFNMIDVGANIGDTAVFTNVEGEYLLIEGEASYNNLIAKNISYQYPNSQIFLASNGGGWI